MYKTKNFLSITRIGEAFYTTWHRKYMFAKWRSAKYLCHVTGLSDGVMEKPCRSPEHRWWIPVAVRTQLLKVLIYRSSTLTKLCYIGIVSMWSVNGNVCMCEYIGVCSHIQQLHTHRQPCTAVEIVHTLPMVLEECLDPKVGIRAKTTRVKEDSLLGSLYIWNRLILVSWQQMYSCNQMSIY